MSKNINVDTSSDDAGLLELDALIIGAGVSGLYQLHLLREMGLSVRICEAGANVGGTWFWNRYPGARLDSESPSYQYLFSEELYKNWTWTERFAAQSEVEAWLNYVADSLNLRPDIDFEATVSSAVWDEGSHRWSVRTSRGDRYKPRFLIACCGMLSAPLTEQFPGQERFEGEIFHTARWPSAGVDLAGKRVGVIGTGATGIQVVQALSDSARELTVFVRTPHYALPMGNVTYSSADVETYKANFSTLKERLPVSFGGFDFAPEHRWADLSPAERTAALERHYAEGSLRLWLASFAELFVDEEVNAEISEFVRAKMRHRLGDDRLSAILVPTDYGFGTRRVPLESGFLETFLRANVHAVSVKANPITAITSSGLQLADGTVHDLDVIIMATGFDAGTGAFARIDFQGRNGLSLRDHWQKNVTSAFGLQVNGFPNLFMTGAPLAPSAALCNMPICLQFQNEWIADCIRHVLESGREAIEPSADIEKAWVEHHDLVASSVLISKTDSWYVGSNVAGKPRRLLAYAGGADAYRTRCLDVAESGYAGFDFT